MSRSDFYSVYFNTLLERLRGVHLARRQDELAAEEEARANSHSSNDPSDGKKMSS